MKKPFIFICLMFSFFQNYYAQDSLNMTKLDQWDPPGQSYNDVWGYVDAYGNEFGILGAREKIHFINLTIPYTPKLIAEFAKSLTQLLMDNASSCANNMNTTTIQKVANCVQNASTASSVRSA